MRLQRSGSALRRLVLVNSTALALACSPLNVYAGTTTYTYDALGRLVATSTPGSAVGYTYDAAGNRVQQGINVTLPITGPVSAIVIANSTSNPIALALTGGAPASVAVSTAAAHGTATASGTSITYTPTAGYVGTDSFQYKATNASGTSAAAVATITVNPQLPVAGAVSQTVGYNSTSTPINLSLSGGAAASVAVAGAASHGTATASGTSISYTPTSNYSGSDTFTYTASNVTGTSAPATVSITVNPALPIAGAASATVAFNSSANPVALNLTGGVATSVTVASVASHGTATASGTSITYTPTSNYSGSDSFTYSATNAAGTSSAATVSITVNPQPPVAANVSNTFAFNSSSNVVTPSVTGGAVATYTVASPTHGYSAVSGSTILYTPFTGYSGADSFQYTATNAGGSSSAMASITVNPAAPVAGAASSTVAYNSTSNAVPLNLSGGAAASVAVATAASHGTASASGTTISYTPTIGYYGADSFTYTATNVAGTSAAATASITVNPPPPITGNVSQTVGWNSTANNIPISLSGGPAASVTVSTPSHGSASASGTTVTYTPTNGYSGADSFTYTATNAGGTSAASTVYITVNPQAAVAGATSISFFSNRANNNITPTLSGGAATSVAVYSQPSNGAASASGTTLTYNPNANFYGTDTFQYTAINGAGTSAPATVTVTVYPAPPVAGTTNVSVGYNSTGNAITPNLSGGPSTSVSIYQAPSKGTATVNGLGFTYTPNTGQYGTDFFLYTATNSDATSAYGSVNVTIIPPPPVANSASSAINYNSMGTTITPPITGAPATSLAIATNPSKGTATVSGLNLIYTPTTGSYGADSFTYTATNAGGTSAPATVSLTISPASSPTANNYSSSVKSNATLTFNPISVAGDTDPNGYALAVTALGTPTIGSTTATLNSGTSVTFNPQGIQSGTSSFTYTISNGHGGTATATISINITKAGGGGNA